MADELRVPPSVTMAFEGAATQICNDAKLDYDEWPLRAYETVTHLQERWRKCIQDGMGTDEAERQALRSFGDFSVVARSHRKPWHVRMLIHQRCRADRFFFFWRRMSFSPGWRFWMFIFEVTLMESLLTWPGLCCRLIRMPWMETKDTRVPSKLLHPSNRDFSSRDWERFSWGWLPWPRWLRFTGDPTLRIVC